MKTGNCVNEAYRLMFRNGGKGEVYYVLEIDGKRVGHAYYVPNIKDLEAKASNHEDNGYGQFPELRVRDVLKYGTKKPLMVNSE